MNKIIYLFWHTRKNHFNFGDDINPFIIENLSDSRVKKVMVFRNKKSIAFDLLKMTHGIIKGFYSFSIFSSYFRSIIHPDYIVCIGSILQNNFSTKAKIWGSGIIHKETFVQKSEFYAVRGLKTVERLKKLGYNFNGKIGDPALLLPLIYNPKIQQTNKIGIIPHVTHFDSAKKIFNNQEKYILIDLSDNNIKQTIELIKSCKHILSSSLHGLIVSHAYNIPALHVQLGAKLSGDGIKFFDYFSSVNIREYKPILISKSQFRDTEDINQLFTKNHEIALPEETLINKLQKDLLCVAPFELSSKYKSYTSNQCD